MGDTFDKISIGFLTALCLIAIVLCIFNFVIPTKRQAYKVHKENDLTIVERVEE